MRPNFGPKNPDLVFLLRIAGLSVTVKHQLSSISAIYMTTNQITNYKLVSR